MDCARHLSGLFFVDVRAFKKLRALCYRNSLMAEWGGNRLNGKRPR
jgi:hypothetical protein